MSLTRRKALAALLACCAAPAAAQTLVEGRPSSGGGLNRPPLARPLPDAKTLIARSGLPGEVGFALADAATGSLIEASAPAGAVPPASTMKAITALYALDRLGADHRFRTRILRAGDMLVLAGGGDPLLDSDALARLADELVASGQASPPRFAVWGGALPRLAELAPQQDDHLAYNPSVSGMILNFNRVHMGWRRNGDGWNISLEARAARQSPRAYTVTATAAAQAPLFVYSEGRTEHWTVSRAALGASGSRWLPVRRPELYAGDVFQTLCRARGLVLPGPEVIEHLPQAEELAGLDSPPLTQILRGMLEHSTNLTAEVVGLHASGAPDLAASAAAMAAWLHDKGQGQGFVLADHSGLSSDSRVTPRGMARLLAMAGPDLIGLLVADPLARDLPRLPRQPQVRAKTGTLNFVSNLAGYIDSGRGDRLAFALLCQDAPRHAASRGRELPEGVITWTRQAKSLQHALLANWSARFA